MKFYLASRYDDRLQLLEIQNRLIAQGHEVTSRWVSGSHELTQGLDQVVEQRRFAEEDLQDIERADVLVLFNNAESLTSVRGGRHVEFGYALASGKVCILVGPRLSVFHYLEYVYQFDCWESFLEATAVFRSRRTAFLRLEQSGAAL